MAKPEITSLPGHIQVLWDEVEALAGRRIEWYDVPTDGFSMASKFYDEGRTPVIESKSYTERGLTEELLHLRLSLKGFPNIEVEIFDDHSDIEIARNLLNNNLLHHHVIFPKLAEFGYDPWKAG